ncbi:polynucleotide kinase-phosphatase [Staphylospora marina]|uniref:polynucleotide kinase-phosphatase n=1 Tax=Staphylospora marina TaxID=2490858 RepID=UPI000F5C2924|nr:polynucleotide kinase-phosphatase [Staphylospora marina]
MKIQIPALSVVVLVGASGAGKSTFARKHFRPTEILSSDAFRAWVGDDETDQSVTNDAFEALHFLMEKRLKIGRLCVVDATNLHKDARQHLLRIARKFHAVPVAVVFDLPEKVLQAHNRKRTDRQLPAHVIHRHAREMRRAVKELKREGFSHVWKFRSPEEAEAAELERVPLWPDKRLETGPFDIVGDVHGCFDELTELLEKLGYRVEGGRERPTASHPEGRRAVFLGDLVDRGPDSPAVLRLVMNMVRDGQAYCVPGNHDVKLVRKLAGKNVQVRHGLEVTLAQLEQEPPEFAEEVRQFLVGLVSHLVLDGGKLVVAHAGMKEEYQGRASVQVRDFALYGETTGETDEYGLPVRLNWAAEYRGKAAVVYGHTPVPDAVWLNNTINIDTGCVFGGRLTALRWPERELVSVPARRVYAEPVRPLKAETDEADEAMNRLPDVAELLDLRVSTDLYGEIRVVREQAAAALEVMSRHAVDPRWLIYLPPTMSPVETSRDPGWLESPREAFAYYRNRGVGQVVCEEKHMGSRAVVIVCRDEEVTKKRFGVEHGGIGIIYTRTGRRFFTDTKMEQALLDRLRGAMERAGFWERMQTDWACLDAELMPWSAKAKELIRSQYAAVGSAARTALPEVVSALEQAQASGRDVEELLARHRERLDNAYRFTEVYGNYCWTVNKLSDLKLAPFHLLATEGAVHTDKDHRWHMETIHEICRQDPEVLLPTEYRVVDLEDPEQTEAASAWWHALTERGGEGMVVKPLGFVTMGERGPVQPAVKVRGREYLRLIYGPDYTVPENMERLKTRGLKKKRSLALREFALGVEGLKRFVEGASLRRVHECAFAVLALESEPVDPRL